MIEEGRVRHVMADRERLRAGRGGETAAARRVTSRVLADVSRQIQSLTEAAAARKGRKPSWLRLLRKLDPDVLAFAALREAFDGIGTGADLSNILVRLGTSVEAEYLASGIAVMGSAGRRSAAEIVRRNDTPHARLRGLRAVAHEAGTAEADAWSSEQRLHAGEPLLNALFMTGLFARESEADASGTVDRLVLTEEGERLVLEADAIAQWERPLFLPMRVPPRPWTRETRGGYHDAALSARVPLVRTRDPDHLRMVNEALRDGRLDLFLRALNLIQSTPLRINRRVLEVVGWCLDNPDAVEEARRHGAAGGIRKFPRMDPLPTLDLPDSSAGLPARMAVQRRNRKIRRMNRGIIGDLLTLRRDLDVAREFAACDRFWLPANTDWRGRIYPVPSFNNQRASHIKALFEFAEGMPLGRDGVRWLMIHVANCGDFDRVSKKNFFERLRWVDDHHDALMAVAQAPTECLWWMLAGDPFGFLAACFDYADAMGSGDPDAHVSHLPIALDGANSGIQHYAAALRSDEARYVNLGTDREPRDLYATIAEKVAAEVKREAEEAGPSDDDPRQVMMERDPTDEGRRRRDAACARLWAAHGVDRSVVKRNVMTFGYGSEVYGFREQLMDDLMAPLELEVLSGFRTEHPFGRDGGAAAASYLASRIHRAVTQTLADVHSGMRFLQNCAAVLADAGLPVRWTTPIGFPVLQQYREWEIKRVKLHLHNTTARVWEWKAADRTDGEGGSARRYTVSVRVRPKSVLIRRKQKSAVAPNVIHGCDAAHLMYSVLAAAAGGVTNFLLIHDSFATHAGNTERFFWTIRNAFVDMYESTDIFAVMAGSARDALGSDKASRLRAPPSRGSFDLEQARGSLYLGPRAVDLIIEWRTGIRTEGGQG